MPSRVKTITVSVDRVEGKAVILESDDGGHFEVPKHALKKPREGLVYRVPLEGSTPVWKAAVADPEETERRKKSLATRMENLRARDGGGDIKL